MGDDTTGRRKTHGGQRQASGQNVHLKTAEALAKEHGVNEKTIRRDGLRVVGYGLVVIPGQIL